MLHVKKGNHAALFGVVERPCQERSFRGVKESDKAEGKIMAKEVVGSFKAGLFERLDSSIQASMIWQQQVTLYGTFPLPTGPPTFNFCPMKTHPVGVWYARVMVGTGGTASSVRNVRRFAGPT